MEASLIQRLEKAVERLEKYTGPLPAGAAAGIAAAAIQAPASTGAAGSMGGAAASSLEEYDTLVASYMKPWIALSQSLHPDALNAAMEYEKAFMAARMVLSVAPRAKQPDNEGLQQLLAPVGGYMGKVSGAAEQRRSPAFHHLKAMAESLNALSFLAYTGPCCGLSPPRQHVAESWQSAEFFANKVLMEARGKDEQQVAWVKALKELLQQLEQFVMRNYATGLKWNRDGLLLEEALKGGSAATAAPAAAPATATAPPKRTGGPPPPPPPGPPPKPPSIEELAALSSGQGGGAGGGVADLFKELQKGEAVTSGLRKVTDDMKAKNRPDRSGVVAATAGSGASAKPAAAAGGKDGMPTGTPRLEKVDRKWYVEYHSGRQDLVVDDTAPSHSIYMYGCKDCVLQVQGKVNAISLDKCVRVGVVFSDVISSAEAVNCSSIQLQVTGSVPTLAIEKTDGAQLYVSKKCAADENFQVVTAKCSNINVVLVPEAGSEEDPQEHAVPEQFISTFKGGHLVTVAAAHSGA